MKSAKAEEFQEEYQNAWVKKDFPVTMDLATRRPRRPLEEHHQVGTLGEASEAVISGPSLKGCEKSR